MKRKTIGIIIAVAVLTFVGGIGWNWRDVPQKRLLADAEDMVFADVDSAARLLERVDTARLTDDTRALYGLMRALVEEERWHLQHTDSASCLHSNVTTSLYSAPGKPQGQSAVWSFARKNPLEEAGERPSADSCTLLHIYTYYERASLGGTTDDRELLRRFGRTCFVLSLQGGELHGQTTDKLLHLAIHCAEECNDHSLAYRAYHRLAEHLDDMRNVQQYLLLMRALSHYRQAPDNTRSLLTLLNDYGSSVLRCGPFSLDRFPSLERVAATVSRCQDLCPSSAVCDTVFLCLDTLWALPAPNFTYVIASRGYRDYLPLEVSVPIQVYDDGAGERKYRIDFDTELQNAAEAFATSEDTYLAAGYVMKTASLQRWLMTAAIAILLLSLLVLTLLFVLWHNRARRRHEADSAAREREAQEMAERLRQKDTAISMLRGHIMDKSEILDMLAPTAGKRTVINARNWREIEMTLDTADGNFVSRLRAAHPQFSEEDIRLCMLARLRLSNNALSAIYLISVSAVQHRKQKLKKDGFGITDPAVTLDQVIANF